MMSSNSLILHCSETQDTSRPSSPFFELPRPFSVQSDDSYRRTTLRERVTGPKPGSHNLSFAKVRNALDHEKDVRKHIETLRSQSESPSVVTLYAASIQHPYTPPAQLSSEPGKRREHLQSMGSTKRRSHSQLLQQAIRSAATPSIHSDKIHLKPLEIPPMMETPALPEYIQQGRTIDKRPASVCGVTIYRDRLSHSEKEINDTNRVPVVYDRPLSPFCSASPRNDPSLVYTPAGIGSLLKTCTIKEEVSPTHHVRRLQSTHDEARPRTEDEDAKIAQEVMVSHQVQRTQTSAKHLKDAQVSLRLSHRSAAAPTANTKSVRNRIGNVRQVLTRKNLSSVDQFSKQDSSSLVSQSTLKFDKVDNRQSNVLLKHRKGIVKRVYNI